MSHKDAATRAEYARKALELEGPSFDTREDRMLQRLKDYAPRYVSEGGSDFWQGWHEHELLQRHRYRKPS